MRIKAILFRNTLASGWGKISTLIFRLVQVPLLLSGLGVQDFGRWTVIASLPSWLALANMGFGGAAGNEMSIAVGANDMPRARSVFSTTLLLIAIICVIGILITTTISPFIPWEKFLNLSFSRRKELSKTVIYLALAVLLSFFGDVFYGRFKAARKAHQGILLFSFLPWLELIAMVISLHFSKRFDDLALAMLLAMAVFILGIQRISWKSMPGLFFSWNGIETNRFRKLLKKGIAFQAFPIGNALLFQGNILIVQAILGPAAVALFSTARTLVRSINQVMELVNQVIWPELSHLFGAGELIKAAKIHRLGVGISALASCLCLIGLGTFGNTIFEFWTGKHIFLSKNLLLLFLLPIPFNCLWFTSSVVHTAFNQHEGLAIRYLIATSISLICSAVLCYYYGINGAALSTIVVDLILIPYVFQRSLKLTEDTWGNFVNGILLELSAIPNFLKRNFGKYY